MSQGPGVRRVLRGIDTWTVLRFSALFYGSMLVVSVVAAVLLWAGASVAGLIDNVEQFVRELFALRSFSFNDAFVLRSLLIGGSIMVLLGSAANVLVAVIYNLTADVVGGIEVTVLENESAETEVGLTSEPTERV